MPVRLISKIALLVTAPLPIVPVFVSSRTPALIVVAPVFVLLFETVSFPRPFLRMPTEPPMLPAPVNV